MYKNIDWIYHIPLFVKDDTRLELSLVIEKCSNILLVSVHDEHKLGRPSYLVGTWQRNQEHSIDGTLCKEWYTPTNTYLPLPDPAIDIINNQINDLINNKFDIDYIQELLTTRVYKKEFTITVNNQQYVQSSVRIIVLKDYALVQTSYSRETNFFAIYEDGKLTILGSLPMLPDLQDEMEKLIKGNYNLMDRDVIQQQLRYKSIEGNI